MASADPVRVSRRGEEGVMRRLAALLLVAVLAFVGFAAVLAPAVPRLGAQEASPAAGDPETLGRRYIEDLLNRGDAAAVDELMAPDFVLHLNTDEIPGPEGLKGFLAGLHQAFPDVNYQIQDL